MQEIYVDDIGEGFPLVLVHGFLGSSEMWYPQKEFFSKYYRVIAPALPGFGESAKTKSLDNISEMANTVLELINKIYMLIYTKNELVKKTTPKRSQKISKIYKHDFEYNYENFLCQ